MNHTYQQHVDLDEGHIVIVHFTSLQHPFGDGKYYYLDKRYRIQEGPYLSIGDCVKAWNTFYGVNPNPNLRPMLPPPPQEPGNPSLTDQRGDLMYGLPSHTFQEVKQQQEDLERKNVIYVDFRSKKRIK